MSSFVDGTLHSSLLGTYSLPQVWIVMPLPKTACLLHFLASAPSKAPLVDFVESEWVQLKALEGNLPLLPMLWWFWGCSSLFIFVLSCLWSTTSLRRGHLLSTCNAETS